jgi:hypothetical protein
MGDLTVHGGVITVGCPTVMIGEVGAGSPISPVIGGAVGNAVGGGGGGGGAGGAGGGDGKAANPQEAAMTEAGEEGAPLVEECPYHKQGDQG